MNKKTNAIFLDRDGVLNKERKDYVKNVNEPYPANFIRLKLIIKRFAKNYKKKTKSKI